MDFKLCLKKASCRVRTVAPDGRKTNSHTGKHLFCPIMASTIRHRPQNSEGKNHSFNLQCYNHSKNKQGPGCKPKSFSPQSTPLTRLLTGPEHHIWL